MKSRNQRRLEEQLRDVGPCYDLCMCRYCWRGWSDLSLRSKVKYRIAYIWHVHVRRSTW